VNTCEMSSVPRAHVVDFWGLAGSLFGFTARSGTAVILGRGARTGTATALDRPVRSWSTDTMGKGKYHEIDIASVKNKADKTILAVKNVLQKAKKSMYNQVVVFLGEDHTSPVDVAVTIGVLANAPVSVANHTYVFWEDGIVVRHPAYGGAPGAAFANGPGILQRTEPPPARGSTNRGRSTTIADSIQDLFDNHGAQFVYVACGDRHGKEVFDSMDKRMTTNFSYFHKPSAV
jgi:hypothetical protein